MSDINIFSDPFSVALIYFIVGTPGIILGATTGALWWRATKSGARRLALRWDMDCAWAWCGFTW